MIEGIEAMYTFGRQIGIPEWTDKAMVYVDYDENLAKFYARERGIPVEHASPVFDSIGLGGTAGHHDIWIETASPGSDRVVDGHHINWVRTTVAHEMGHFYHKRLEGLNTDPQAFADWPHTWPAWLAEGFAEVLSHLALHNQGYKTYYISRKKYIQQATAANVSLARTVDHPTQVSPKERTCIYKCGALATELLISRFGFQKVFDYARNLQPERHRDEWEYSFEETFGLTSQEFYRQFEEHREAGFPPVALPDNAGVDKTSDVLTATATDLGWKTTEDVSQLTRKIVVDASTVMHDYLTSIGFPDTGYRVNLYLYGQEDRMVQAIASEDGLSLEKARDRLNRNYPSTSGKKWMVLNSSDDWFKTTDIPGQMTFVAQEMFHRYQGTMATANSAEPYWLSTGSAAWLAYRALSGQMVYHYPDVRQNMIAGTRNAAKPLEEMETWQGYTSASGNRSYAMLAVELLAERSGEESLVRYYMNRTPSETWQVTFLKTFGMTPEEFYRLFNTHHAAGFPDPGAG